MPKENRNIMLCFFHQGDLGVFRFDRLLLRSLRGSREVGDSVALALPYSKLDVTVRCSADHGNPRVSAGKERVVRSGFLAQSSEPNLVHRQYRRSYRTLPG